MTTTPNFLWQEIAFSVGNIRYPDTPIYIGNGEVPNPITIPSGLQMVAYVQVTGDPLVMFTADVTDLSHDLTSVSSTDGLYPQSVIFASGIMQNGTTIESIDESTVTCTGYGLIDATDQTIYASDERPKGTLAVTVTPDTGISIFGYNYDGSTQSQFDDGSAMSDPWGAGAGYFFITFGDPGTFTVSTTFTSADTNYSDATMTNPLTIIVT